jgi:hypothetical protein
MFGKLSGFSTIVHVTFPSESPIKSPARHQTAFPGPKSAALAARRRFQTQCQRHPQRQLRLRHRSQPRLPMTSQILSSRKLNDSAAICANTAYLGTGTADTGIGRDPSMKQNRTRRRRGQRRSRETLESSRQPCHTLRTASSSTWLHARAHNMSVPSERECQEVLTAFASKRRVNWELRTAHALESITCRHLSSRATSHPKRQG